MEGSLYRSFNMMPRHQPLEPNPSQNRRQSSENDSRRSSNNSCRSSQQKYWGESGQSNQKVWGESGHSSGGASGAFFALSSTLGREIQSLKNQGQGGSSGALNRSNKKWTPKAMRSSSLGEDNHIATTAAPSQQPSSGYQNQQWTAADRAQHVARSSFLKGLLSFEVEQAGVVTAAGYRAVHHKFLFGEEVEKEMNRATERRQGKPKNRQNRSSLFSSFLASSMGSRGLSASEPPCAGCDNGHPAAALAKKLSSGSGTSRRNSNSQENMDGSKAKNNIAPRRRDSQFLTNSQQEDIFQETQKFRAQENRKLMMDSFAADLDRSDNGDLDRSLDDCDHASGEQCSEEDDASVLSEGSQDSIRWPSSNVNNNISLPLIDARDGSSSSFQRPQHERKESNDSLNLQDIFDSIDGSQPFSSLIETDPLAKKSNNARSSDVLTSTCTSLSRGGNFSGNDFNEINFDPDTSHDANCTKTRRDQEALNSSDHFSSSTDGCSWLPWPEQKNGDVSGKDVNVPGEDLVVKDAPIPGRDLLVSFHRREDSYEPWPAPSRRDSGLARAA